MPPDQCKPHTSLTRENHTVVLIHNRCERPHVSDLRDTANGDGDGDGNGNGNDNDNDNDNGRRAC